jgi:hypothetical protein
MIANFEEITEELTEDEKKLIGPLIRGLRHRTSKNPIKAPKIVKIMNEYAEECGLIKISEVRLRKLVNYVRSTGRAPIIATARGYFMSYDQEEIRLQIRSLRQRARSIDSCADGLEGFLSDH